MRLAVASAAISSYCDHAEHVEVTDRSVIGSVGAELRALAVELAAANSIDVVDTYRRRLEAVERRHPLYPVGGFAATDHIPDRDATWRLLQSVQWNHDHHYHPDVFGLSRYEQLRHYALHLAKLAGAAAEAANGNPKALFDARFPDLLLFGVKLATVVGDGLPEEPVATASR